MLLYELLPSGAGEQVSLPDDVIVVSQVKPLAVLPGVINHAHAGHEVHHLFPRRVVQVIPALVAPVPVDPVQSEPAARGAPVRHAHSSDGHRVLRRPAAAAGSSSGLKSSTTADLMSV